jgi:glyoxylase-like metal-dependent hydrolase (beta-lactamase superfamily II)
MTSSEPSIAMGVEKPHLVLSSEHPTEIEAGIWAIPVSVPISGLDLVFVYALLADAGVILIDAGWNARESLTSLCSGLHRIGSHLRDVQIVLFTHGHRDHYGLAGTVKQISGARLALHRADLPLVRGRVAGVDPARLDDWLKREGVIDRAARKDMLKPRKPLPTAQVPDLELADGQVVDIPPWKISVIHTPGHSAGHVCFIEKMTGLVFTGDHLLPKITPNVTRGPNTLSNPLEHYIRALESLRGMGDITGAAGHVGLVDSIAVRAGEVMSHHERKLEEIHGILQCHDTGTTCDIAERVAWSRSWESLPPSGRRLAIGEAHAHLEYLVSQGVIRREREAPWRWMLR